MHLNQALPVAGRHVFATTNYRHFGIQSELIKKKDDKSHSEDNESDVKEITTENRSLKFIEKNSLLKQIFKREPSK